MLYIRNQTLERRAPYPPARPIKSPRAMSRGELLQAVSRCLSLRELTMHQPVMKELDKQPNNVQQVAPNTPQLGPVEASFLHVSVSSGDDNIVVGAAYKKKAASA